MADRPVQDRKLKLPRTNIGGRDLTVYDPHIALQIVERVAEGETLGKICTLKNSMPARQTFMKWMAREPSLRKAYMGARELSALAMEEEALDGARDLKDAPMTANMVRAAEIAINQLRWSAARRDPKNYGDKGLASTIVPIHISTTLNMGDGVKQQASEIPDIYTIDITPEQEPEEKSLIARGGPMKKVLTPRMGPDVYVKEEKEREKAQKRNAFSKLSEYIPEHPDDKSV
jgi:Bacteriophage Sf6, terminase small subunit-like